LKLGEQRKFVLWWDGRGNKGGNPTLTGLSRLQDLGVDNKTLSRWRIRLKDEKKSERRLGELLRG
jgi:hypothetical protein